MRIYSPHLPLRTSGSFTIFACIWCVPWETLIPVSIWISSSLQLMTRPNKQYAKRGALRQSLLRKPGTRRVRPLGHFSKYGFHRVGLFRKKGVFDSRSLIVELCEIYLHLTYSKQSFEFLISHSGLHLLLCKSKFAQSVSLRFRRQTHDY